MNQNEALVILTGIQKLDFVTKEGEIVKGVKVFYSIPQNNDMYSGFIPGSSFLPLSTLPKYNNIKYPCYAETVTQTYHTPKGPNHKYVDFTILQEFQYPEFQYPEFQSEKTEK